MKVFYAHSLANRVGQIVGPLDRRRARDVLRLADAVRALRDPDDGVRVPRPAAAGAEARCPRAPRSRLGRGDGPDRGRPAGVRRDVPDPVPEPDGEADLLALPFWTVSFFGLGTFTCGLLRRRVQPRALRARRDLLAISDVVGVVALFFGGRIVQRLVAAQPGARDEAARRCPRSVSRPGIVVMALSPNLPIAIAGYLFSSFMGAMLLPGALATISFVIPPHMRTLGFATGNLWLLLGAPLIPIVGAIGDAVGVRYGILLSVPTYLFGVVPLLVGRVDDRSRHRARPAVRPRAGGDVQEPPGGHGQAAHLPRPRCRATTACRSCSRSTSRSATARSSRCSGRTAPASRRC